MAQKVLPGELPAVARLRINAALDEKADTSIGLFTTSLSIPVYPVASLPTATTAHVIYVADASGGAIMAFGDGTNFLRVTDRSIVD